MNQANAVPVHIGTLHRVAQQLPYFVDWSVAQLKAIAPACATLRVTEPMLLQRRQGLEPFAYFLLQGSVHLTDADGSQRDIHAGELDAGYPIAHTRPGRCDLLARPGAELLRIEASKLRGQQRQRGPVNPLADTLDHDQDWLNLPLVQRLLQQVQQGTLTLPALPGIALRLRHLMAQDNFRLDDVGAMVAADPAIVARLLQVANCAVFGGHTRCDSVKSALGRLGTIRTQQVVMSLVARDLFVARHPALRTLMLQRWRHAVDIAALCAVLARLTPWLQSERAMLVGLLHEVGVLPVIRLAEDYPDCVANETLLGDLLHRLTPELSALLLEHWQFDGDFSHAARCQRHWFREHEGPADYTDVLIIAHLHAQARQRSALQLPRIDETPAFEKLAMGKLTPSLSLQVLEEARAQIDELKALLA